MKIRNSSQGFTLIELLVVVLIIGILAAIALPQYRKAKEKAEATQLLTSVKALHEAQQRYYLVNGVFAESFDNLDVEFEGFERGGCEDFSIFNPKDCLSNNKNVIQLVKGSYGLSFAALRKQGKYKYSGFIFVEETLLEVPNSNLICYEYNQNGFCSDLLKCDLTYQLNTTNEYYSCKF